MRVPNISIYNNAKYNLSGLTSDLQDSNEIMATQKRINSISDDPIGLSQVLDLKTSIGNLDQIEKNVNMGISWLDGAETAMDSINSLILEAKTDVSRLINASMSADEREDAIERVNDIMEQIISLGNTQINGNYIFSGTDTDILPFEHLETSTSEQVAYYGNSNPFEIKTDKEITVPVGRDGETTFWDSRVSINSTNDTIMFMEDNGHGSAAELVMKARIEYGEYTPDELAKAVRNALNDVSSRQGYGVTYEVEYNEIEKAFSIREDGSYNGFIRTEFMWETEENAYITGINASSSVNPDDINLTVVDEQALTIDTPEPHGTEPFRLVWQENDTWEIQNNPGYVIFPSTISGTRNGVSIDLDENGTADIEINLDNPVTTKGQFIEFEIVSAKGDHSVGHEMGFSDADMVYEPPTSDTNAVFITDITIAPGNDTIRFVEVDPALGALGPLTATIPAATYTDMDALSSAIGTAMSNESTALGYGITYTVSYDPVEGLFNIREDGSALEELHLLWTDPLASATGTTLGYAVQDDIITYPQSDYPVEMAVTIDGSNNAIAFMETDGLGNPGPVLWASVTPGTYYTAASLETAIEDAMNTASFNSGYVSTYDADYNAGTGEFSIQHLGGTALNELDLLWGTADMAGNSIGTTLGYDPLDVIGTGLAPHTGDSVMVLMSFDDTNNVIDFEEVGVDGTVENIAVRIPAGNYTDLGVLAADIQTALRTGSPNSVQYVVEYDDIADEFSIRGSDASIREFSLLWETGDNRTRSPADMLGFLGDDTVSFSESDQPVVNIDITAANNVINFTEMLPGDEGKTLNELTALIEPNTYTSHEQLALEVEKALEEESYLNGNKIDYSVSWDDYTRHFTIKENGTQLAGFNLLWATGENAPLSAGGTGESIGEILGFDIEDDTAAPVETKDEVKWGIFETLIDTKKYLAENDTYGLERTLGRLETHFDMMTSRIVDIGIKYNRLEIREKITIETSLSLTERRSTIEDADMIEAVMDLQSIETAYKASLSSSAKILDLSLVDYLR